MKRRKQSSLVLPATAALVLLADQVSKRLVIAWLGEGQSWDIAPWLAPIFRITHVTNTGGAFGLLPRWGDVFILVAVIVIAAIILYYRHLPGDQWLLHVALGLQLGGAIGNNLIDRLGQGFVVDFIDLNFWPLHEWPVFNVADVSIVTGATLLVLLLLWEERREQVKKQAAEGG